MILSMNIYIWKGTHEVYNKDHLEIEQRTGMKRKDSLEKQYEKLKSSLKNSIFFDPNV